METVLIVLLILYFAKIMFFYTGAVRASAIPTIEHEPSVTVIVAARNEERNIVQCIEALSRIDYPESKLEILIIDDQSTDRTGEIILDWADRLPQLTPLQTKGAVHGLKGKANAVAQAIEVASGEIILTTDADCRVQEGWVKQTVKHYTDDVGCVCGFTLIKTSGPFSGMQFLDWSYLLTIASAGIGWNFPLSAVGNNMSFRRTAYEDVGGYEAVGFSVTEDFALFQAIASKSKWTVRYPVDSDALVWSEPCANLSEVYHQKKRWGKGGLDVPFMGWLIMSVGFFLNLGLIFLPVFGLPLLYLAAGIGVKFLLDLLLLQFPLKKMRQYRKLKYFLVFEVYLFIYVTLLPFVVLLTGRVLWKGRKL